MSSSAADVDLSALSISDVSAIPVAEGIADHMAESADSTRLTSTNMVSTLTASKIHAPSYKCEDCDMVCKSHSALLKHQVFIAKFSPKISLSWSELVRLEVD